VDRESFRFHGEVMPSSLLEAESSEMETETQSRRRRHEGSKLDSFEKEYLTTAIGNHDTDARDNAKVRCVWVVVDIRRGMR